MRPSFGVINSWPSDPSIGSGTAASIGGFQEALRAAGHRVEAFTPRRLRRSLTLSRLVFNAMVLPTLRKARVDYLLGFDLDGWLYALNRVRRRPYFVFLKGILADEARHESGITRRLLQFQSLFERVNARRSDRVFVPSHYSASVAHRLYGVPMASLEVLPEGIDLRRWKRVKSGRDASVLTILCVARQYPRKRVDLLIRAYAKLKQEFPRLRLHIVGDGPEFSKLKSLAKSLNCSETLLGPLPHFRDLRREYQNADIFCLPSVQEGFGIVFLEAMASGLPIVASNAAAIPEVIPHKEVGLLGRPHRLDDLIHNLRRLIVEKKLRASLAAAGLKRVRRYDWNRIAKEFVRQMAERNKVFSGPERYLPRGSERRCK